MGSCVSEPLSSWSSRDPKMMSDKGDGDGSSGGSYSGTGTKADLGNHSNQGNPNHSQHQGYSGSYSGSGTKADIDNHSSQMNPNNAEEPKQEKKEERLGRFQR